MNDFTLEELKVTLAAFDWIEGETSWPWDSELRNKIRSMIDNYCQHSVLKDVGKEYKVCRLCADEIYE